MQSSETVGSQASLASSRRGEAKVCISGTSVSRRDHACSQLPPNTVCSGTNTDCWNKLTCLCAQDSHDDDDITT